MKLDGKNIVVTGAASGIGKAVVLELLKYDVKILAVDRENKEMIPKDENVVPLICDVSTKKNVDYIFHEALNKLGSIDIFIANAGFGYLEKLDGADWDCMDYIFKTNIYSPIYSFEKMMEINKGKKSQTIVVGSAVGKFPMPGYTLYSTTKYALNGFAKNYNYEKNDNNLLSMVYPVGTDTNFFYAAAGHKSNPVLPKPFQSAEKVAKSIIKGIQYDLKWIYPSKMFYFTFNIINRVLPVVYWLYDKTLQKKFFVWWCRYKVYENK